MLDAGPAVGNLSEVVFAKLLLLLEAEGTMIGGDDLQVIVLESIPELLLVPLLAQRRSENILSTFEAGRVHVIE